MPAATLVIDQADLQWSSSSASLFHLWSVGMTSGLCVLGVLELESHLQIAALDSNADRQPAGGSLHIRRLPSWSYAAAQAGGDVVSGDLPGTCTTAYHWVLDGGSPTGAMCQLPEKPIPAMVSQNRDQGQAADSPRGWVPCSRLQAVDQVLVPSSRTLSLPRWPAGGRCSPVTHSRKDSSSSCSSGRPAAGPPRIVITAAASDVD